MSAPLPPRRDLRSPDRGLGAPFAPPRSVATGLALTPLRARLDALVDGFDYARHLEHDPLRFVARCQHEDDAEVVGFVAAALAYGGVDRVLYSVGRVLDAMGPHPASFVRDFDPRGRAERRRFAGFVHRFTAEAEIRALCHGLGTLLRTHGSLEKTFGTAQALDAPTIRPGLVALVEQLRASMAGELAREVRRRASAADGEIEAEEKRQRRRLHFLLPSPAEGSACKRLNLWLRWMVRRDGRIDRGAWTAARPSQLILPLDTHTVRLSGYLGLTRSKTPNWQMAEEVTSALRGLDPDDPVKYDFALCHLGISGDCRRRRDPLVCPECPIEEVCRL